MKVSLTFLSLFFAACVFAQNLSGTWEGLLVPSSTLRYFMHLELKQEGRKITGIFYYKPLQSKEAYSLCEISGELGKKDTFPFRLISGSILDHRSDYMGSFGFENIRYLKDDSDQILYGRYDYGGFAVRKIVDSYPLIEKYNKKNE